MSNKIPIFPIPEQPQQFTHYGFHPQFHYFQVLEEARRNNKIRETTRSTAAIDIHNFKLQKPISRSDESSKKIKKKNSKKRWWKNALQFFKIKSQKQQRFNQEGGIRGSISGPVYITESNSSRSGSSTPYRTTTTTSRPYSGPLAGSLSPATKGEIGIPYINLRDINIEPPQQYHRLSTSAMPIYFVT